MPNNNPTSVTLDLRASASNGGGWVNVQAGNGATYSYLYTGGNNGNNGSVAFTIGRGNAAVTLGFAGSTDGRFQFGTNAVMFENDPNSQLSTHGNAPRTRVINDRCTDLLDGSFKVTVTDTAANTTIACDPVLQNKPT